MSALDELLKASILANISNKKALDKINQAGAEYSDLRSENERLKADAKLFIEYIKDGKNDKAHLQMLVLESLLYHSEEQ